MYKNTKTEIIVSGTTEPTTPPTIAPTFVLLPPLFSSGGSPELFMGIGWLVELPVMVDDLEVELGVGVDCLGVMELLSVVDETVGIGVGASSGSRPMDIAMASLYVWSGSIVTL